MREEGAIEIQLNLVHHNRQRQFDVVAQFASAENRVCALGVLFAVVGSTKLQLLGPHNHVFIACFLQSLHLGKIGGVVETGVLLPQ
jgi:hypothetical protein